RFPLSFATSSVILILVSIFLASAIEAEAKKKVLLYSRTEGFRHYSIPTAIKIIRSLGKNNKPGWQSFATEDASKFEKKGWLEQFDAIVFVSVSGKALSHEGAENMRKYIQKGGGYMGIHEACDALHDYSWYGRLVGGFFDYHPEICHAKLRIEDHSHPSVAHLGSTWEVYDEMYNFLSNPTDVGKKLVLSADDNSYPDPVNSIAYRARLQGSPHPIAWYKEGHQLNHNPHRKLGGGLDPTRAERKAGQAGSGGDGRSFYTALGHTNKIWHQKDFQEHVLGALQWVLESPSLRSNDPTKQVGSKYTGVANNATNNPSDPTTASSSKS
ncbi:class I glutamine amidotransferase-like protein, partial [Violaceomyces palustris]